MSKAELIATIPFIAIVLGASIVAGQGPAQAAQDVPAEAARQAVAEAEPLVGDIVDLGEIRLNVVDQGEGPAVLLLHGFPDSAQLWRHQVPALVDAGFRVIVPDLRGFGLSDRPEGVESYALGAVMGDLLALLDHLEIERAHVVGHDWGAAVAWTMAIFVPQRVDHLAALSVGHPGAFGNPSNVEQSRRSFYMLYFQFEDVAEANLPRDDWALWKLWFGEHSEQETWFADLSRPGALTAALSYYRANLRPSAEPGVPPPAVAAPTMGMWSTGDVALTEEQMMQSSAFVTSSFRYERIDDASHWIPLDAPEQVNQLLLDFLPCPQDGGCAEEPGEPNDPDPADPTPSEPVGESGGCSVATAGASSGAGMTAGLWLLLAVVVARRKRARRR